MLLQILEIPINVLSVDLFKTLLISNIKLLLLNIINY